MIFLPFIGAISKTWVVVGVTIALSKNIALFQDFAALSREAITGRGGCGLCNRMVSLILLKDDPKSVNCRALCLSGRFQRCISMCEKVALSLRSTALFPCHALRACDVDDMEGGAISSSCEFDWRRRSCEPHGICNLRWEGVLPRCKVRSGVRDFVRYTSSFTQNSAALAEAMRDSPRCGQEGSSPIFCVNEPTGTGRIAMLCSYALAFVAVCLSIRAVETPGGDDDTQWLSFWIIFFFTTAIERLSDVVLSKMVAYYEIKLVILIYLMFFKGAERMYRTIHRWRRVLRSFTIARKILGTDQDFNQPAMSEEEYLDLLAHDVRLKELVDDARRIGMHELMRDVKSYTYIVDKYGHHAWEGLESIWQDTEPHAVIVKVCLAKGLMPSHYYVVLYLIGPQEVQGRASLLKAGLPLHLLGSENPGESIGTYWYSRIRTGRNAQPGAPSWNHTVEMYLEGGEIDHRGDFRNPLAPWTVLRAELWTCETKSKDALVGHTEITLASIMDGRLHCGWHVLTGVDAANAQRSSSPGGATPQIFLELQIHS